MRIVKIQRACEIYGPDEHPCCGEVDGPCLFEVEAYEDTRTKEEKKLDILYLIEEYAEKRHTCGCKEYNTKTQKAYDAIQEALKGL